MKVTLKQLYNMNACRSQWWTVAGEWFRDNPTKELTLTLEVLLRAAELRLDLDWFFAQVLPARVVTKYNDAQQEIWNQYCDNTEQIRSNYIVERDLLFSNNTYTPELLLELDATTLQRTKPFLIEYFTKIAHLVNSEFLGDNNEPV